jgi:heat shock protein HspQ
MKPKFKIKQRVHHEVYGTGIVINISLSMFYSEVRYDVLFKESNFIQNLTESSLV